MYNAVKSNDATGQPIWPGKSSSTSNDVVNVLSPFQKPRGHNGSYILEFYVVVAAIYGTRENTH